MNCKILALKERRVIPPTIQSGKFCHSAPLVCVLPCFLLTGPMQDYIIESDLAFRTRFQLKPVVCGNNGSLKLPSTGKELRRNTKRDILK